MIHEINLGGETAVTEATWSLLDAADRDGQWKPGGYQLLALDAKAGRLYVGMHDAARDGSHKFPAKELWAFDINTKKRVQRIEGSNSIAMSLSDEDEPYLYVYDGMTTEFVKYETLPALKPVARSGPFGEFAGLIELH